MDHHRFADLRLVAGAALLLVATLSAPARAEVVSLTVGLTTACPYGVPN